MGGSDIINTVNASLEIHENVALAPLTTLGIGGPARFFAEARDEQSASAALAFAAERALPLFVLGGGSNVLVADEGFPGLVLHICIRGVSEKKAEDKVIFTLGAGEEWDCFVRAAVERGLGGVECLSGIPGTVGGTPIQNVGAYGQEVSETIAAVRVCDRAARQILTLSNAECGFSYRHSTFLSSARDRYIVLSVTYALPVDGRPQVSYPDVQKHFASSTPPTLRAVREAVRAIRASKAMLLVPGDPDCRSAGSFFKNPVIREEQYAALNARSPAPVPRYPVRNGAGLVKVPAAWLIERAGFHKGYGPGPVGLSSKHTLALVNRGGATARDVLALMREIRDAVHERFGILLAPEPQFVGFADLNHG
jgi:UDP-N-acetylmuramate dehydrogenase